MRGVRRGAALGIVGLVATASVATAATSAGSSIRHAQAEVTVRSERFVDRHRRTPAVKAAHLEAKRSRTLPTTIWAPSGDGPYPLIVFAHGCNGHGRDYEPLLRTWAGAGYVVAAPDFPISSKDTPDYTCVTDVVNQPGDVSFVITRVLELDRAKNGLGGIVDRHHIGVAGHSLGGVTTLGVAFRSCCRDGRIDAAISFAGTPLIRGTDFRKVKTPLMLVHGDADPTVEYGASLASFHRAQGRRFLLTILGGDHGGYIGGTDPVSQTVLRATLDFWAGELRGDDTALARVETDGVLPGATTLQQAG